MIRLSEDYIRSLEPETLRYDVKIDDDFVISVLPNGIKTWAFLYEYQGRQRRKTLGVYPDMSHEQALTALSNARKMIAKLGGIVKDSQLDDALASEPDPPRDADRPPPAQRPAVLASGLRRPRRKSQLLKGRSRNLWVPGLVCVALIGLAAGAYTWWRSSATPAPGVSTAPAPIQRAAPEPIVLEPGTPDTDAETPTEDGDAPPTPPDNDEPAPPPAAATQDSAPPGSDPLPQTDASVVAQVPVTLRADTRLDGGDARDSPGAFAGEDAGSDALDREASEPTRLDTPPAGATARAGRVTRAIVTSGVTDNEPDDDLGTDIVLVNGGYQTVFYFTELREFSAGHVVHRWIVNGRVIADVPLRVDGGWRWRTYSSKDLLPGMTGDWTVALVDAEGTVLGERNFTFGR